MKKKLIFHTFILIIVAIVFVIITKCVLVFIQNIYSNNTTKAKTVASKKTTKKIQMLLNILKLQLM